MPIPSFQIKTLRKASAPLDFLLYKAALEFDLIEPIVIESQEDIKSERSWNIDFEPYHHQVKNLITFCRRLPVTLLADDVGLGKTISAGLIISELLIRGRISKMLIVCPKLLIPQWKEELKIKFNIDSQKAVGRDLATYDPENNLAVITTYNSARIYFDEIAKKGFDMLILDEAHKLRNLYGTDKPPEVAKRFKKALADRLFKYVLMLTATPIQNRLWDLYSLVDLLTVARGHENPFGSENTFARKFIADSKSDARKLQTENKEEFRSIVYGYMSRCRRADARLDFPERKVQLHKVKATSDEKELFKIIAEPIQDLNALSQISIAQALVSSPQALSAQLNHMAENKTVPIQLAIQVKSIVSKIGDTAKLSGLGSLLEKLRTEQPEKWRAVIFTGRQVTQGIIEEYLRKKGIESGLINGTTGSKNQETLEKFKKEIPDIHVIISTEAGSEGINLQVANVVVNYDLPWNPMIVEQRIGRVQRLASSHASVCVFNMILEGTFEEHIVGRLMEKLQLASHAVGDVEALLEAAGLEGEDEDFEQKIRKLVIASLAGKDVATATRKAEKSIADAKAELEREEANINLMLGGMGDLNNSEPRCPKLPTPTHSMNVKEFVFTAIEKLGGKISDNNGRTEYNLDIKNELLCFDKDAKNITATLFAPGTPALNRLVNRITLNGLHDVNDIDTKDILNKAENILKSWVTRFNGKLIKTELEEVWRSFKGKAILKVRTTVAHDSYERLVEIECSPKESNKKFGRPGLGSIGELIDDPNSIGLNSTEMISKALQDPGVLEFSRFYEERLKQELSSAGQDPRKIKKLQDDFTPRNEVVLVALEGTVQRFLQMVATYKINSEVKYSSHLIFFPSSGEITESPTLEKCEVTEKEFPQDCLAVCSVSKKKALKELLVISEVSGRYAMPEFSAVCSFTGKKVLKDELEKSSISGQLVISRILKTSELSGKRAEPNFFGKCEFTSTEVLQSELAISQISGKKYRIDEQLKSSVSGKLGHKHEFIYCALTDQPLLTSEAEKCEVTGKIVIPGILEKCEITGKNVIPTELEKSSYSGKKALKKFFVNSSISEAKLLESEAVRSVTGKFCSPLETRRCRWSGRSCHPEDLRTCQLTGLEIHYGYVTTDGYSRLEPLSNLLNGTRQKFDKQELWNNISNVAATSLNEKNCQIKNAEVSPDEQKLAVCLEIKSWLGLKLRYAGFLFSIKDQAIEGRIALGKAIQVKGITKGWILVEENVLTK